MGEICCLRGLILAPAAAYNNHRERVHQTREEGQLRLVFLILDKLWMAVSKIGLTICREVGGRRLKTCPEPTGRLLLCLKTQRHVGWPCIVSVSPLSSQSLIGWTHQLCSVVGPPPFQPPALHRALILSSYLPKLNRGIGTFRAWPILSIILFYWYWFYWLRVIKYVSVHAAEWKGKVITESYQDSTGQSVTTWTRLGCSAGPAIPICSSRGDSESL